MTQETIVVSGATGFLGSRLCVRLAAEGHSVVALKRSTSDTRRLDGVLDRIMAVDVDRVSLGDVIRRERGITTIIHAAAHYGRGDATRAEVFEANYAFPCELLTTAIAAGVGLFVNSGTALPREVSLYAEAKNDFLEVARRLALGGQIRLCNLRLQHIYGPGDDAEKFVSHLVRTCAANAPEVRLTAGEQRRDFVYVDDVVEAYMLILARRAQFSDHVVDYDVGSGAALPVRQFAELVQRVTKSRTRLQFGAVPYRPSEVMFAQADIGALTSLGWKCKNSPETGVLKTVQGERVAR
jgi:nucleoside-diphosphate-sugar epimerase